MEQVSQTPEPLARGIDGTGNMPGGCSLLRPTAVTWVLVASLFLVGLLFPEGLPRGVFVSGIVLGSSADLSVTALVLVQQEPHHQLRAGADRSDGRDGGLLLAEEVSFSGRAGGDTVAGTSSMTINVDSGA